MLYEQGRTSSVVDDLKIVLVLPPRYEAGRVDLEVTEGLAAAAATAGAANGGGVDEVRVVTMVVHHLEPLCLCEVKHRAFSQTAGCCWIRFGFEN